LLEERDTHFDFTDGRPHDCAACLAKRSVERVKSASAATSVVVHVGAASAVVTRSRSTRSHACYLRAGTCKKTKCKCCAVFGRPVKSPIVLRRHPGDRGATFARAKSLKNYV
jgi:hypothetical protein